MQPYCELLEQFSLSAPSTIENESTRLAHASATALVRQSIAIHWLATRPDKQGRGQATSLVLAACYEAEKRGCGVLVAANNPQTVSRYSPVLIGECGYLPR